MHKLMWGVPWGKLVTQWLFMLNTVSWSYYITAAKLVNAKHFKE
jgi:hypothetical protein